MLHDLMGYQLIAAMVVVVAGLFCPPLAARLMGLDDDEKEDQS